MTFTLAEGKDIGTSNDMERYTVAVPSGTLHVIATKTPDGTNRDIAVTFSSAADGDIQPAIDAAPALPVPLLGTDVVPATRDGVLYNTTVARILNYGTILANDSDVGSDTKGDGVIITAGTGDGTEVGGAVTITGGKGGANAAGGAITIISGVGGTATGDGGDITLSSGAGTTSGKGGAVNLLGGAGKGSMDGGEIIITAGLGGETTGKGGLVAITTGAGNGTAGAGGAMSLVTGGGIGTSDGGALTLTTGIGGATTTGGKGGPITITSGAGKGTAGAGGAITVQAGAGLGSGAGGNLLLNSGKAGTTGAAGLVEINNQAGLITAAFHWDKDEGVHERTIFTAIAPMRVIGVTGRVDAKNGQALTVVPQIAASGTLFAAGVALTKAAFDLDAATTIVQSPALTDTSANRNLAAGDSIGLIIATGTLGTTGLGGMTFYLAPLPA